MDFRIKIDGTEITDQPEGLDQWTEDAALDRELQMLMFEYPVDLTFWGGGFKFLKDHYDTLGFDGILDVVITSKNSIGEISQELVGKLFLGEIQWNYKLATAEVKVRDAGFNAKVRGYKDTQGVISTATSRNGETITAATSLGLRIHNQDSGNYDVANRDAYDLLDAINWVVQFITDGDITVVSNFYDGLSTDSSDETLHKIAILTGEEVRTANSGIAPKVSFVTLYEFMVNAFGLQGAIETDSTGAKTIRIEPYDYFEDDPDVEIINIDEIEMSIDFGRLYSDVKVGSQEFIKDENASDGYPIPYFPPLAYGAETFVIKGKAATGGTKDITTEICTDTNVIYELHTVGSSSNDKYDDLIIAMEYYISGGVNFSYLKNIFNKDIYNKNLVTFEILNRHRWYDDVYSRVEASDDYAYVALTDNTYENNSLNAISGTTTIEPFKFDDDYSGLQYIDSLSELRSTSDVNNRYGNGTVQGNPVAAADSRYTAPASGYYFFQTQVMFDYFKNNTRGVALQITLGNKHYNSGGSLIATQDHTMSYGIIASTDNPLILLFSAPFFMAQNDYIQPFVEIQWNYLGFSSIAPNDQITFRAYQSYPGGVIRSYFEAFYVQNGGGVIALGDKENYPVEVIKFEKHIKGAAWESIRGNLNKSVAIQGANFPKANCLIKRISREAKTGMATFELYKKYSE